VAKGEARSLGTFRAETRRKGMSHNNDDGLPREPDSDWALSRRELLRRAGLLGASLSAGTVLAACGGDDEEPGGAPATKQATAAPKLEDELNIIAWAQEWEFAKGPFEKETGVKVNMTFQASEAESLQKVKASPEAFDVVSFGTNFPGYAEAGLLRELDPDELEHWNDLPESMRQRVEESFDGKILHIPYYWGSTLLARHTEIVKEPVDSLAALWDPAYKGKTSFLDQPFESHSHLAFYVGLDASDISDEALAKEREAALELIPNLKTFWSTGTDIQQFLARGEVGLTNIWDGTLRALIKAKRPVEPIFAKEGVRGWIDGPGILAAAKNPNAAVAWVNYVTRPETGAELADKFAYTPANPKSFEAIDTATKELLQVEQVEELFETGRFVVPAYGAGAVKTLSDWWTAVKAAA
jgi:spermidine/putrescine transport system substrate-binding protein